MARTTGGPSRIEVLILSTVARRPMHGYEIKTELRYRHVRWWAKCEHGHLYSALARLEDKGHLRRTKDTDNRGKRTYAITAKGKRALHAALETLMSEPDPVYFDVDLFLSGSYVLEREETLSLLTACAEGLRDRLEQAQALQTRMAGVIPTAGRLIIEHRIEHLTREISFVERAADTLRAEKSWGAFLGDESIGEFIERTRAPLED